MIVRTRFVMEEATLAGYMETRSSTGQPTLVKRPESEVRGYLTKNLGDGALQRLAGYFGPNYNRETVCVKRDGRKTSAYVFLLKDEPVIPEGILNFHDDGQ